MHRSSRFLCWLPALLLIGLIPLSAQTVVVQVTQEETGLPVSGAFLSFLREDGTVIRNALTNAEGRFLFRSEVPGAISVRAEMIGRKRVEETGLVLGEDSTINLHMSLPINAISLEGIEVQAEGQCRLRPDEASEIFLVWEEARKALKAQEWTQRSEFYRYQILSYERDLDPDALRTLREDRRVRTSVTQVPFQSLPSHELQERGFVHPLDDGGHMYYGPDAEVLLSDFFLDSHCFRLQANPEAPERIGLGFEPVRLNDRPDISGTFWLNRETAGLESLEFQYTWAPFREARGVAGGRVEFQAMPNGAWIVKNWWIRMPRLQRARALPGNEGSGVRLIGVRETGAEVSNLSLANLDQLSRAEPGSLSGSVWDSVRAVPLAGAQVYLSGTQFSTQTDSVGRFLLGELPEGVFTATFTHPRLDSLGVRVTGIDIEVSSGSTIELDLALPSWPTVLAAACGEETEVQSFVVTGRVRDSASGDPLPGAEVRLEWKGAQDRVSGVFRNRDHWFETRTSEDGTFVACGIPLHESIEVQASFMDHETEKDSLRASEGDIRGLDLLLALPPELSSGQEEPAVSGIGPIESLGTVAGEMYLAGKVVDARSQSPVPSPMVVLMDESGEVVATTSGNSAGNFRLRPPESGEFRLRVHSLGYAPAEGVVTAVGGQTVTLRVLLEVQPVDVEGIVARGNPTPRSGGMTFGGFMARKASGPGTFFDEADIVERKPSRLSDLASRAPGMVVLRQGGRTLGVYSYRSQGGLRGSGSSGICLPDIWLDGLKVRPGGYGVRGTHTDYLNEIVPPDQVAGIEIYSGVSQIPAQFNGPTAMCGVVVLWSRR